MRRDLSLPLKLKSLVDSIKYKMNKTNTQFSHFMLKSFQKVFI